MLSYKYYSLNLLFCEFLTAGVGKTLQFCLMCGKIDSVIYIGVMRYEI